MGTKTVDRTALARCIDMSEQPTGWLLPDGSWLAVRSNEYHHEAAARVSEPHPEASGWVHVRWGGVAPVGELTGAQFDAIVQWCDTSGAELPFWLQDVTVTR